MELRPISSDEYEDWYRAEARGHGRELRQGELEAVRPTIEWDRSLVALDQGKSVGTANAHTVGVTVPGGETLPSANVDLVAVLPTHRRKGIFTRMMAQQLRDIHERGETLAVLVASESAIYGRLGYGIGSQQENWTVATEHKAITIPGEPAGALRFVAPEEARQVLPPIYDRVSSQRPGMVKYGTAMWDLFVLGPAWSVPPFRAVYEEGGEALGYAKYQVADGELLVQELMAVTAEAYASLWRLCLDVQRISSVRAERRPLDDPLPQMLEDPRRLDRRVSDRMWLRLVDVGAALSARRYMRCGRLVLEVRDPLCPWNEGRYELEGRADGADCKTSTADADIVLSAADLASTYLGAVRFSTLARARRVEEMTAGALRRADAMFATQLQPWAPYNL